MKSGDVLFGTGSAIMLFGMSAIESTGVGAVFSISSVAVGVVLATSGYLTKKLHNGRMETDRGAKKFANVKEDERRSNAHQWI